jgi:hypothetical protein
MYGDVIAIGSVRRHTYETCRVSTDRHLDEESLETTQEIALQMPFSLQ